jgi:leader peptidase (prepilin peptidase)/N-methyltransferase
MTTLPLIMGLVVALVLGVSIGSFLNVVIWRVPQGQSISNPVWSYCPKCETRLVGWDLVPLFSFLFLGRKCRYCGQPISWRYFTVEAITGIVYSLLFCKFGWTIDTVFYCLFASTLIAAFYIDLDWFFIPDELSVIGFALGIALNVAHYWIEPPAAVWTFGTVRILASLGSGIVGALVFHLISFAGAVYYHHKIGAESSRMGLGERIFGFWRGVTQDYLYLGAKYSGAAAIIPAARRFVAKMDAEWATTAPAEDGIEIKTREDVAAEIEADEDQTGMGQGDAKLAAAIGSVLLLKLSLAAYFIAIFLGGVIGVVLICLNKLTGKSAIPFGPYLVVGALLSLFFGDALIHWYQTIAFPVNAVP